MNEKYYSRILLSLVSLFAIFGCTTNDDSRCKEPPSLDYAKSDLKYYNLNGDVRYVAEFYTSDTLKQIKGSLTFSKQGLLKMKLSYDTDGELVEDNYFKHDSLQRIIWAKENNRDYDSYLFEKHYYDTLGYNHAVHTYGTMFPDSLDYWIYFIDDGAGHLVKDSVVEDDRSTVSLFRNTFNTNGQPLIIEKVQDDSIIKRIDTYRYNSLNKIINHTSLRGSQGGMSIYKWKNDLIFEKAIYSINSDLDTLLEKRLRFGPQQDLLNETSYERGIKTKVIVKSYEYDENCNWIKQTVRTKLWDVDYSVEIIREIVYW